MKVLFISDEGNLLPLAVRVKGEGHNVLLFINKASYKNIGKGMLNVSEMRGSITLGNNSNKGLMDSLLQFNPDFVVLDSCKLGNIAKEIHSTKPVFGSDPTTDRLQVDSHYLDTILKVISVNSKNENTLLDSEYTIGFWFDGSNTYLHNASVYHKGFMNGDAGCNIGDAGHTTILIPKDNKYILVEGLTKFLKQTMYRGSVNLHIANGKITSIDTNVNYALLELYKGNIVDLLQGFALGRVKHYDLHNGVGISVRLSIPPFPNKGDVPDTSITFEDGAKNHLWLKDVCFADTKYQCAKCDGDIGYVTAGATTIKYCRDRVYRTIGRLKINDLQFRSDIGYNVSNVFNEINNETSNNS